MTLKGPSSLVFAASLLLPAFASGQVGMTDLSKPDGLLHPVWNQPQGQVGGKSPWPNAIMPEAANLLGPDGMSEIRKTCWLQTVRHDEEVAKHASSVPNVAAGEATPPYYLPAGVDAGRFIDNLDQAKGRALASESAHVYAARRLAAQTQAAIDRFLLTPKNARSLEVAHEALLSSCLQYGERMTARRMYVFALYWQGRAREARVTRAIQTVLRGFGLRD